MKKFWISLLLMIVLQGCNQFTENKIMVIEGRLNSINKATFCPGSKIIVGTKAFVTDLDMQYLRQMLYRNVTVVYNTHSRCVLDYSTDNIKPILDGSE